MPNRAVLGNLAVGDGEPVAVIGALNVSPESFYSGSVHSISVELLAAAREMEKAGASIIDVGAMSTAPYLDTGISEEEEADRLGRAVEALAGEISVPLSADTSRSVPAKAALEAGAAIINDVSGLMDDPALAALVVRYGAGVIAMASEREGFNGGSPIETVLALLGETLRIAERAGVPLSRVAVDPGIGFFRRGALPWHEWDSALIRDLGSLRVLGRPICVGVSRKSFIGALAGAADPADRLSGSLAAAAVAVVNGAHLIRTHDVAETVQAVRVARAISARSQV